MGEAGGLIDQLVTQTGLDEAAILAAMRDNLDAIASLVTGAPGSGTPSAEGDMAAAAAASRVRADKLELALKKAREKATETETQLAAERVRADAAMIDLAILKGHLLPVHREPYASLAASNREAFVKAMAEAAESPAIDTTELANTDAQKPRTRAVGHVSEVWDDAAVEKLRRSLKAAKIPDERIEAVIAEKMGN